MIEWRLERANQNRDLLTNSSEERVHCHRILKREEIATVENWLGFIIDLMVETKKVRY